ERVGAANWEHQARLGDPLNSFARIKDFARVGRLARHCTKQPESRAAGCLSICRVPRYPTGDNPDSGDFRIGRLLPFCYPIRRGRAEGDGMTARLRVPFMPENID